MKSRKKRNPASPKWQDHYTRKAKSENYPARSVYKLDAIQKKFRLIQKGNRVLDLGCSPGSWLLLASKLVGEKGVVTGIDIKPVAGKLPQNTQVMTLNIFDLDEKTDFPDKPFHVILSDMAPATTGNKHADAARSFTLAEAALTIAEKWLIPGGSFVCKIFQGEDFQLFSENVKKIFNKRKFYKPISSRKESREIFVIGLEKKQEAVHVRS